MAGSSSNVPEGVRVSELTLVEGAQRVAVPPKGNQWLCPNCEQLIPPLRIVFLGKPPKYREQLNDCIKCPHCKFIFSPRSEAIVLRG